MIYPSDQDYQETRQIMLGKATMKPEFRPLADWIDQTYGVKTINIFYDTFEDRGVRPRLEICFEFEREKAVFLDETNNFERKKQAILADKFKRTLEEQGFLENKGMFSVPGDSTRGPYVTDNILIIYGAFEYAAKNEANGNIPADKILELKHGLKCPDLWDIQQGIWIPVFYLYTDQQVKEYKHSETRKVWTNNYFDLLEPYNEWGYFKRETYSIYLDSKEQFDFRQESY